MKKIKITSTQAKIVWDKLILTLFIAMLFYAVWRDLHADNNVDNVFTLTMLAAFCSGLGVKLVEGLVSIYSRNDDDERSNNKNN